MRDQRGGQGGVCGAREGRALEIYEAGEFVFYFYFNFSYTRFFTCLLVAERPVFGVWGWVEE